jgi:hypothetical protein
LEREKEREVCEMEEDIYQQSEVSGENKSKRSRRGRSDEEGYPHFS